MTKKFSISTKAFFIVIVIFWLIYAGFSLNQPVSPETLERWPVLAEGINYQLLILLIAVPLLGIWLFATYGASKINEYAMSINESEDGKAFAKIAKGLFVLVISMVLSSLIGVLVNRLNVAYPDLKTSIEMYHNIARNYLTIIFSLVAYYLIYQGSKRLLSVINIKITQKELMTYVVVPLAIFVGLYGWMLFHNEYRTISDNPNINPTYYVNDVLIFLTIFIPYLAIWFMGLAAAMHTLIFSSRVSGILYKASLKKFSIGILLIIYLTMGLQLLGQVPETFSESALSVIVALIVVILGVILIGYGFIAWGAKKLSKLEAIGGGAIKEITNT